MYKLIPRDADLHDTRDRPQIDVTEKNTLALAWGAKGVDGADLDAVDFRRDVSLSMRLILEEREGALIQLGRARSRLLGSEESKGKRVKKRKGRVPRRGKHRP